MANRALLDSFWRAQERIGDEVRQASLQNWDRVNPLSLEATGSAWLAFMLNLIRINRTRARETAASFYRLHRAIETGYTLPPLSGEPMEQTTMRDLWADWATQTGTALAPTAEDSYAIQVDDFTWPDEPAEDFDRASVTSLASQALSPLQVMVADPGEDEQVPLLRRLEDQMIASGTRGAQAADREAQRGGRDLINRASQEDKRLVGFARITDGDPCHFCAMLASRGAVYRSRQRAELGGRRKPEGSPDARNPRNRRPPVTLADLSRYHNGCHCQAVPVYTNDDFLTDESARYAREWAEVTRNLSGANARSAWRRHIEASR